MNVRVGPSLSKRTSVTPDWFRGPLRGEENGLTGTILLRIGGPRNESGVTKKMGKRLDPQHRSHMR